MLIIYKYIKSCSMEKDYIQWKIQNFCLGEAKGVVTRLERKAQRTCSEGDLCITVLYLVHIY